MTMTAHDGGRRASTRGSDASVVHRTPEGTADRRPPRDSSVARAGSGGSAPDPSSSDAATPDPGDPSGGQDAGSHSRQYHAARQRRTRPVPTAGTATSATPARPGHCAERATTTRLHRLRRLRLHVFYRRRHLPHRLRHRRFEGRVSRRAALRRRRHQQLSLPLPGRIGSGDRTLYQSCDVEHGNADCMNGLLASRPRHHGGRPRLLHHACSSDMQQCIGLGGSVDISCNSTINVCLPLRLLQQRLPLRHGLRAGLRPEPLPLPAVARRRRQSPVFGRLCAGTAVRFDPPFALRKGPEPTRTTAAFAPVRALPALVRFLEVF